MNRDRHSLALPCQTPGCLPALRSLQRFGLVRRLGSRLVALNEVLRLVHEPARGMPPHRGLAARLQPAPAAHQLADAGAGGIRRRSTVRQAAAACVRAGSRLTAGQCLGLRSASWRATRSCCSPPAARGAGPACRRAPRAPSAAGWPPCRGRPSPHPRERLEGAEQVVQRRPPDRRPHARRGRGHARATTDDRGHLGSPRVRPCPSIGAGLSSRSGSERGGRSRPWSRARYDLPRPPAGPSACPDPVDHRAEAQPGAMPRGEPRSSL